MIPENYIRFGMQRKRDFLKDAQKAFGGLVIPANILLYQYKSTPAVIYGFNGKPFIIDPMSYLFGQEFEGFKRKLDDGSYEFKPSFAKLMLNHGMDVSEFIGLNYNQLLSFLKKPNNLKTFVNNCLGFQANFAFEKFKIHSKGLISEDAQIDSALLKPQFLIPPYFLNNSDGATEPLNLEILKYCDGLKSDIPIHPLLFVSKADLNSGHAHDLAKDYAAKSFPSFCLWVNEFDELEATKEEIERLIDVVWTLSRGNTSPIFVLYGGYFQMTLKSFGVKTVAHGTLFSESKSSKDAVRKSSGPAPVRYYVPHLHDFLTLEGATAVLRKLDSLLCSCSACKRVLRGKPENIPLFGGEEELAEMHFLQNRIFEKQNISGTKPQEIAEYLNTVHETYAEDFKKITKRRGDKEYPLADIDGLARWAKGLSGKAVQYRLT